MKKIKRKKLKDYCEFDDKELKKIKNIQIIGNASKIQKRGCELVFKGSLLNHKKYLLKEDKEFFKKYEIKKTKEQIKIIEGVNEIIKNIFKDIGIKSNGIPADNIHILPCNAFEKLRGKELVAGSTNCIKQMIIINKNQLKNNLFFCFINISRNFTFRKFFVIRVNKGKSIKPVIKTTKRGIYKIIDFKKTMGVHEYEYGKGLDEAVISYQENKSYFDILNIPELKKERDYIKSKKYKEAKEGISKKRKIPKKEIFWISKKKWSSNTGYYFQKKVLYFVLDEIQKKFFKKYKNKEEVFKEFLKANYKRNQIKKIKELVKDVFGKYGFNVLMGMSEDDDSAITTYQLLKLFYKERK